MTTNLPDGFTRPLHQITQDDHGGYASITTGCTLVFVLIFAAIRLWNTGQIGYHYDDTALFIGTVIYLVQAVLVLIAVDLGLGQFPRVVNQESFLSAGKYLRWIVVEGLGMLAEISSFVLIVRLYVDLQVHWGLKIRGLLVFGLRLMITIFVAYRLLSLSDFRSTSNPLFDRVQVVVWTQVELGFGLITASIPCLLALMGKLNSVWAAMNPESVIEQSQLRSQKVTGGSYELGPYQPNHGTRSHKDGLASEPSHQWAIIASKDERRSLASDDSNGYMIRRTIEVSSTTEPRYS
ncbi:hypothetical protein LTR49_027425 [Elasticomyces elasticus]|nr:hypothetical protein LTR49_027425 [Elasticomyces elasticus]